ncbi:MAG: radical SAM family heme chaperone HemW [Rubripirellula sp.]
MALKSETRCVWAPPRSAYIHVPFCRHRCGYCNFSVVANRDDLIERYLSAVEVELQELACPPVDTVFVGGGTPTHFDLGTLQRFLQLIRQRFDLSSLVEWSMEANPEDITSEKVALLHEHGVNRVSLGVQSFHPAKLAMLERSHTPEGATRAVELVVDQIPNVSIDLIFAAPNETPDQWRQDLSTALALPITHLSTYALTFEKGTSFWSRRVRGDLHGIDELQEVEMYEASREMTADAGMTHYEISNFATPGYQCRHNLAYWNGRGWYAAGPGAARFVSGHRDANHRSTTTYLRRIEQGQCPTAERELLDEEEYARERAAFGVRMIAGVDLDAIEGETGVAIQDLCRDSIERSIKEALLVYSKPNRIKLTERGILFADLVASRLLG